MGEGLGRSSSQNEVHTLNVSQGPAQPKTENPQYLTPPGLLSALESLGSTLRNYLASFILRPTRTGARDTWEFPLKKKPVSFLCQSHPGWGDFLS